MGNLVCTERKGPRRDHRQAYLFGDRHQQVRREDAQPDTLLRPDPRRTEASRITLFRRHAPCLHGSVLAKRQELALCTIELQRLPSPGRTADHSGKWNGAAPFEIDWAVLILLGASDKVCELAFVAVINSSVSFS